jgi:hypothetical protein
MVKKVFNWMLMAALVVGFSMSFNACSNDDDDKESESEKITKIANQVWAYSTHLCPDVVHHRQAAAPAVQGRERIIRP